MFDSDDPNLTSRTRCAGLLLAGGGGSRLGASIPKQFMRLGGETVLLRAARALGASDHISELVVVVPRDWIDATSTELERIDSAVALRVVAGGETRNDSTYAGLRAISEEVEIVVIHDAARPFLTREIVDRAIAPLVNGDADASDVLVPTADTIVEISEDRRWLRRIPDREFLMRGQTPQVFFRQQLLQAYEYLTPGHATQTNFTDDCGVLLNHRPDARIAAVEGAVRNMKITYEEDLLVADSYLRQATLEREQEPLDQTAIPGPTAVIGGSSGIGLSIVEELGRRGAGVFSGSRRTGHDITTEAGRASFLDAASDTLGIINHLIITAGELTRGNIEDIPASDIVTQVDVNLTGPLLLARDAYLRCPNLQSVTFVGSSSYSRGRASYASYSAAKAALVAVTQALADEWVDAGVRVNIVVPERTRTPMRLRNFGEESGPMLSAGQVANSVINTLGSDSSGAIILVREHLGVV